MDKEEEELYKERDAVLYSEFSKVKTFEDLINGYIKYYNGEIKFSPNSFGPLEEDTIKQLDLIKNINQAGFLTTDSQDGLVNEGIYNGNKYKIVQRAYIIGFMKKLLYDKLYSFIKYTDLVCLGYDILSEPFETDMRILVTYDEFAKIDHTRIPITSDGMSEWNSITTYSPKIEEPNDLYFVSIFDPTWRRSNYMVETIHDILLDKNLGRIQGEDSSHWLGKYKKYKQKYLKLKYM